MQKGADPVAAEAAAFKALQEVRTEGTDPLQRSGAFQLFYFFSGFLKEAIEGVLDLLELVVHLQSADGGDGCIGNDCGCKKSGGEVDPKIRDQQGHPVNGRMDPENQHHGKKSEDHSAQQADAAV